MTVIAHLSDIHFDAGERSAERGARMLRYFSRLSTPIDALVVTGDIADTGSTAEYEQATMLRTLPVPVLMCPGNHDTRETMRKILLDQPAEPDPINHWYRLGDAIVVMCDSTVPGRDYGTLTDETIAWLDSVLADSAGTPALVCFHHPPVRLGPEFIDELRQFGERRLAEVISRHPDVVGLLCGHAHTAAATTFAGVPLLVAPGVDSAIRLPWESGHIVDFNQPPAIAFHLLDDDRRLTTHFRVVP